MLENTSQGGYTSRMLTASVPNERKKKDPVSGHSLSISMSVAGASFFKSQVREDHSYHQVNHGNGSKSFLSFQGVCLYIYEKPLSNEIPISIHPILPILQISPAFSRKNVYFNSKLI